MSSTPNHQNLIESRVKRRKEQHYAQEAEMGNRLEGVGETLGTGDEEMTIDQVSTPFSPYFSLPSSRPKRAFLIIGECSS
jgi:hypothetical protein